MYGSPAVGIGLIVVAAAAAAAAGGDPVGTRSDDATTGADGTPVLTELPYMSHDPREFSSPRVASGIGIVEKCQIPQE